MYVNIITPPNHLAQGHDDRPGRNTVFLVTIVWIEAFWQSERIWNWPSGWWHSRHYEQATLLSRYRWVSLWVYRVPVLNFMTFLLYIQLLMHVTERTACCKVSWQSNPIIVETSSWHMHLKVCDACPCGLLIFPPCFLRSKACSTGRVGSLISLFCKLANMGDRSEDVKSSSSCPYLWKAFQRINFDLFQDQMPWLYCKLDSRTTTDAKFICLWSPQPMSVVLCVCGQVRLVCVSLTFLTVFEAVPTTGPPLAGPLSGFGHNLTAPAQKRPMPHTQRPNLLFFPHILGMT